MATRDATRSLGAQAEARYDHPDMSDQAKERTLLLATVRVPSIVIGVKRRGLSWA